MSKLVVEVCKVDKVEDHPNANKMKLAVIKGWKTCVKHDPDTNWTQFKEGDLCVYFPPDSVLPEALVDRLGIRQYVKELPKDELGQRPPGGRVAAANLRGFPSFGVIMAIDPKLGDDPNWTVGTDVAEHFGVTKFEPPLECVDGDAAKPCPRFYMYTNMEHYQNYPESLIDGEEIVLTEKIHGKNCRMGLVFDNDWEFMAGSHNVQRKEFAIQNRRFQLNVLIENGIFKESPSVDTIFMYDNHYWKVEECYTCAVKPIVMHEGKKTFGPEEMRSYVSTVRCSKDGEKFMVKSDFWEFMTPNVKSLLEYVRDQYPWDGNKSSIVMYGEFYGAVGQDLTYGLSGKAFRAFDLAVNNNYLDFDVKVDLFKRFGVEMVPILYRGPCSREVIEKYTDGPTTMCDAKDIKTSFKGREGVVIIPTKERFCPIVGKRCCFKSVSAAYLGRKGGTDEH